MTAGETILQAAVKKGLPGVTDEIREQVIKLLCQVGQLESGNAALETGLKAVSSRCYWRNMGYCDLGCSGRVFCDVNGLSAFNFSLLHQDTPAPCPWPIEREGEEDHRLQACASGGGQDG
jgi:hypothetical protein